MLNMNTFLKILTLFISIGAVGGAVMMWIDPTGATCDWKRRHDCCGKRTYRWIRLLSRSVCSPLPDSTATSYSPTA